jgi:hypothetical protein
MASKKSSESGSKPGAKKALPVIVPIVGWSPTKLAAYDECPFKTQLKYGQSLCPLCFKGAVPYEGPCNSCGKVPEKAPALKRGIELDDKITSWLSVMTGTGDRMKAGNLGVTEHPVVVKHLQALSRKQPKGTQVLVQESLVFTDSWLKVSQFTRGAWLRTKLDVLILAGEKATVLDWKSGGLTKTGEVRPNEKYDDQLEIYQVCVMSAYPKVQKVDASLVFLDAKPPNHPVVTRPSVDRGDLRKLQKKWEGRVVPLFADKTFAPRPGFYCGWCDYAHKKGGPCAY